MKCRISKSIVVVQTIILLAALFVGTGPVFSQDFFIGKVLSVDSEQMEITLAPKQTGNVFGTGTERENILVRIAEVNNLTRDGRTVVFPGCVVAGRTIRLWGRKMENEKNVFLATDIRGCMGGGCGDPTGVRSRLLQRGEKRRYSQPDSYSGEQGAGSHDFDGSSHGGSGHGGGGGNGGGGGGGGGGR